MDAYTILVDELKSLLSDIINGRYGKGNDVDIETIDKEIDQISNKVWNSFEEDE